MMEIIKKIWETNKEVPQIHLPGWWLFHLKEVSEVSTLTIDEENLSQWQDLLKRMHQIITLWLKKSKKWEISSFDTLQEKIVSLPGGTCQTSLSSEVRDLFLKYWEYSTVTENPDEQECLDIQSNTITSTLSTTAPSADRGAGTSSAANLNLSDTLCQLADKISPYGNFGAQISTMSSHISFLRRGEPVKFGLEEKIGKRRLTVSVE